MATYGTLQVRSRVCLVAAAHRHLTRPVTAAARRLREHSRLVGAMVGALAGFRQQDAVHGLPLQLSPEEVTLAAHKGACTLPPRAACQV